MDHSLSGGHFEEVEGLPCFFCFFWVYQIPLWSKYQAYTHRLYDTPAPDGGLVEWRGGENGGGGGGGEGKQGLPACSGCASLGSACYSPLVKPTGTEQDEMETINERRDGDGENMKRRNKKRGSNYSGKQ